MTTLYEIETCFSDADWHRWRRTGIGASEAASIAGASKTPSRMDVWLSKLGQGTPWEPTEAMEWGHRLEDDIAEAYTRRTGLGFTGHQVHVRSKERPWQIASLDAMAEDGRVVEFKTTGLWSSRRIEEGDAETLPKAWHFQVQHQLAITGARIADLAVFTPELRLLVFTIARHEPLIEALSELESEFWRFVEQKMPPPALDLGDVEQVIRWSGVDDRRVTLGDDALAAVQVYEDAAEGIRHLEKVKAGAKDTILRFMGNASKGVLPDGRQVCLSTTAVAERTQVVKAHTQLRMTFRKGQNGD